MPVFSHSLGHLERFPPERLSGRCRIGQETSAGAYSGGGLAPISDLPPTHTPEEEVRSIRTFLAQVPGRLGRAWGGHSRRILAYASRRLRLVRQEALLPL